MANACAHTGPLLGRLAFAAVLAAPAACALAAGEAPASRYGDWGQAIYAIVVFLLLAAILGKWAWKPIIAEMRRREEEIARNVRQAEQRRKEADELEGKYRARLAQVEQEARHALSEAAKEAQQSREEILAKAREEARRHVAGAEAEIESLKDEAIKDLRETTAGLAARIAGQIIYEELDPAAHQKLVDRSLERIREGVEKQS